MKQAVILAGGKGNRLKNLTDFVLKPLLPINGKAVLESIICNLVDAGVENIVLSVDYLKEEIFDFVEKKNNFGINIKYFEVCADEQKKGAALGIYKMENFVSGDFLLCACDTIFPTSYMSRIMEFHEKNKNFVTLSISDLGKKEYLVGRSVVSLDSNNNVTRILEKPEMSEVFSTIVSTPLYVFNDVVFDYVSKINPSKRGEYELQTIIQKMVDDGYAVKGFMNEKWNELDNWRMLNDCSDFLRLNFPYLNEKLELK